MPEKEITVRTFIAVEMPESVKGVIEDVQGLLKRSGADVGWTKPGGVHLTLRFLGPVKEQRIPEIAKAVDEAVKGTAPFSLEVRGTGVFPNPRLARVVWMGLTGAVDELSALQRKVEEACEGLGFGREDKPFRPHVTLGRIKSPKFKDALLRNLDGLSDTKFGKLDITAVSIMMSELKPAGAVYTEMHRAELK
ncbi:MAG TPA: RNA 2',3'-cyclic phosphodiesterase [Nitrospirota bacterium]|jgi:2'-5' RNA ligase